MNQNSKTLRVHHCHFMYLIRDRSDRLPSCIKWASSEQGFFNGMLYRQLAKITKKNDFVEEGHETAIFAPRGSYTNIALKFIVESFVSLTKVHGI